MARLVGEHARVISASLWNFSSQGPREYLLLAAKSNKYERIEVTDEDGRLFIEIAGQEPGFADSLLLSLGLMHTHETASDVFYKDRNIGRILVLWYSQTIYAYLYALVCLFLLLCGVWLYFRLLDAKRNLENRVAERTKELRRAYSELKASEERYALAVQGANDGFWDWDLETNAVYFSPRYKEMLGYEDHEFPNRAEAWMERVHPDDLERVMVENQKIPDGDADHFEVEYRLRRKDGSWCWIQGRGTGFRAADGKVSRMGGTHTDITGRKEAEEKIMASLHEKDILLKEIHHRVKNNLQIISSLLFLQSEKTSNPEVLELFRESQGRIHSMALVHEELYRSEDLALVDLGAYVDKLVGRLFASFGRGRRIDCRVGVQGVSLSVEQAIPCGLIINELVTNALKYAFAGNEEGVIEVSISTEGPDVVLAVRDDGAGLPEDMDIYRTETLGMQLVVGLAEQLGGKVKVVSGQGTSFVLAFPAGG